MKEMEIKERGRKTEWEYRKEDGNGMGRSKHLKEARLHELIGTRETSFLSQLSTSGELEDRGRNWEESVGTVTRVANERLTGMSDVERVTRNK